jgi:predicted dehydrogenase
MGLIGCGNHGERYLRHLVAGDVPGVTARAFWRRDPQRARTLAGRYGVDAVPDLSALLSRGDVDAWVVTTPPANHLPELLAAAATGRPILVEKPLTGTWAQARTLEEELPGSARVMVAQTLRWNPALIEARRLLPGLGTLHRVRATQRLEPTDLAWQRDREVAGGGSVVLTGVHLFDLVRWLLGATPARVRCRTLALAGHPLENLFDACFEMSDPPCLVSCEVSKFSASRSGWLEVVGTEGQLWVDYAGGELWEIQGRERRRVAAPGDAPTLPAVLADFAAFARGEIECPVPLREGLESMRMVESCYRSHDQDRTVETSEVR